MAKPVLDTSDTGKPVLASGGPVGAASGPPSAPNEDVFVDIQLAPGAVPLRASLTANTAAFLGGAATTAAPSAVGGLATVLSRYGLVEARALHGDTEVLDDDQRRRDLRQLASVGAASPDQVAALEQLPSKASLVRLKFPPGTSVAAIKEALRQLPEVDKAEWAPQAAPPMALATAPPADPLVGSGGIAVVDPGTQLETQWYLHRTGVPQAWRYSRGANVIVADIDWGYRTSHQEFAGAIDRTYNSVSGNAGVTNGLHAAHGTAVLGIAGARADGVGMAGYAPEATLWAIQADSSPQPRVFQEAWAEAIDFVRRTDTGGRRKVIILEAQTSPVLGNYEQLLPVHRAIRAAIADNCVVCVAAGNGDRPADLNDFNEPFDPTGSILVGATAYHGTLNKRAAFSNYGSRVVVSAPGDPFHDLTSAQSADAAYRNGFGGTSGATPKVAGVVALMLSVNPDLTHADVREILVGTGSPLTEDPGKPIGVFLNAEAAVAEALRRRTETAPDVPVTAPDGEPSPEVTTAKRLHGIRRRRGQLALPDESISSIRWDGGPDAGLAASAAQVEGAGAAPSAGGPPANDKMLQSFRHGIEGTLTQQDRVLIVEQAIHMLDNFYVHRPLKEAIHAVRPIQRLRVLLRRLQQTANIPAEEKDELNFHNTLTEIFNSVRDLHTGYQLPRPYRDYIAYLPFEVAHFYEGDRRRYLVTRVVPGYVFANAEFGPGAELLYWNGMAIERAVRRNSEQTAGSNEAARHARGVSSLTIRPMNTALPPDADYVDIGFVPRDRDAHDASTLREMRQFWFVRYAPLTASGTAASAPASAAIGLPASMPATVAPPVPAAHLSLDLARESTARSSTVLFEETPPAPPEQPAPYPAAVPPAAGRARNLAFAAALGLDAAADTVREARQLIFDPDSLVQAQRANVGDDATGLRGSASPSTVAESVGTDISVKVPWNAAFRARTLDIAGPKYGYIHIRTFYVPDADGFVQEFVRLLEQMPENGLILDVRGNGGGNIWAAERLLQTLSPVEIAPERMQFVVSPGTLDLCRNNPDTSPIPLHVWRPSIEEAVETGAVYSHAFPLTEPDSCNAIGQRYYGPVVLVVDGNCYSATDIFAAGFQDHGIGKVIGVSNNTGAGGANVWEHWLITEALPPGWRLKPLPNQVGMRVAIRQCLRVGPKAGALLEDFGVVPDEFYKLRRGDIMEGDRELLAFSAATLARARPRSIKVLGSAPSPSDTAKRQLTIATKGLERLDFYLDDRPQGSFNLAVDPAGAAVVKPSLDSGIKLTLVGYHKDKDAGLKPAALYRGQVP